MPPVEPKHGCQAMTSLGGEVRDGFRSFSWMSPRSRLSEQPNLLVRDFRGRTVSRILRSGCQVGFLVFDRVY